MAVVQISKIQLRRGKRLESGLPQLASGEMAWAIDTQELYVGNGAVSEGAPLVGNTKILTEHDNILDLLDQYKYKPSDTSILTGLNGNVTERTVQQRLDEGRVNAASFGISGLNSSVDQTALIQNAINSVYITTTASNRVAIEFDPGTYRITGTLYIPSYVRLIGSGKNHTVFNFVKGGINTGTSLSLTPGVAIAVASGSTASYPTLATTAVTGTGSGAIFAITRTSAGSSTYQTSNTQITVLNSGSGYAVGDVIKVLGTALGGATPANDLTITLGSNETGFYDYPVFNTTTVFEFINNSSTVLSRNTTPTDYNNQVRDVLLKDFNVTTSVDGIRSFYILNVRDSEFVNLRTSGTWENADGTVANSIAMELQATSSVITTQRNKFMGIEAEGFTYGAYSNTNIIHNHFDDCVFKTLQKGVSFGEGTASGEPGPRKNTVSNSLFDTISQYGLLVDKGYGNRSQANTYINVGNDTMGNGSPPGTGPIVKYGQIKFTTAGNSSLQDSFDRAIDLATGNWAEPYVPEIEGHAQLQQNMPTTISLLYSTTNIQAFRLPLNTSSGFEVDYVFQSTNFTQMRKGKLHIAVDKNNSTVQLVDEYEYVGTPSEDSRVVFSAQVVTNRGVKTVVVNYTNDNIGDVNTFTYSYSALS
jgi:hypothetical protein